jgi:hypothetical protein
MGASSSFANRRAAFCRDCWSPVNEKSIGGVSDPKPGRSVATGAVELYPVNLSPVQGWENISGRIANKREAVPDP